MAKEFRAKEFRKTGLDAVGDLPWGTHFCYFYETIQDLLDFQIPYVKSGLESREYCLWLTPEAELTMNDATNALQRTLPSLDSYLAENSLEIVPYEKWFLDQGVFDPRDVATGLIEKLTQVLARGYDGLRVSGSPLSIPVKDRHQIRELEEEMDRIIADKRMLVSCGYPLENGRASEILDATRTHHLAMTLGNGVWQIIETPRLRQNKQGTARRNVGLEKRVAERTRKLVATNDELRNEIIERERTEAALKESRQRYESLVNSIDAIIVEKDGRNFRPTFVSQQAEKILGYPLEQWLTEPNFWATHLHPDDREWVVEAKYNAVVKGEGINLEYRMIAADGRVIWFRDIITIHTSRDNTVRIRAVMVDITERKQVEAQLKATTEQLRALAGGMAYAREEESLRISREIHDELGSALTGLKMDLSFLAKKLPESSTHAVRQLVKSMLALVDETMQKVRNISAELRPPVLDVLGLAAAIEWQAREFQRRTAIPCRIVSLEEDIPLGTDESAAVVRIFQEALTNILRHAQATRVEVDMKSEDGNLMLTVRDNGIGIAEDGRSGFETLGILEMQERAHLIGGEVKITGIQGKGTEVKVRVPLAE